MVCCLLFSPAVSDQNPPDKHPLDHNPPCLLLFVGRLGSEHRLVGRIASEIRVSVSFQQNTRRVLSYDVLRQQKTGVMTKGCLTSLRFRCITSSPSQTLRRRLMRTTDDGRRGECSMLAAVRRGFVFHTSRLVRLTTL